MSIYILMKILESAPSRYDTGIRLLTLGRLDKAYDRCKISEKPDEDGILKLNSWLIQQRVDLIGS